MRALLFIILLGLANGFAQHSTSPLIILFIDNNNPETRDTCYYEVSDKFNYDCDGATIDSTWEVFGVKKRWIDEVNIYIHVAFYTENSLVLYDYDCWIPIIYDNKKLYLSSNR